MSNVGRVITVVMKINDDEKSKEIWKSFSDDKDILGAQITAISNGDLVDKVEKLEECLQEIREIEWCNPRIEHVFEKYKEQELKEYKEYYKDFK